MVTKVHYKHSWETTLTCSLQINRALSRGNVGLPRSTWSIFAGSLLLVRLCQLYELASALLSTLGELGQINRDAIFSSRKRLHHLLELGFGVVSYHKLEGKESSVDARGTFQYLDCGRLLDEEGLRQLMQCLVLGKLRQHQLEEPRQRSLRLHHQLPHAIGRIGGKSEGIAHSLDLILVSAVDRHISGS